MPPESPRRDPTRTASERSRDDSRPPGAARAASSRPLDAVCSTAADSSITADSSTTADSSATANHSTPANRSATADLTRRQLVRTIGTGAALLGGSTALSGAAAGQSSEPEDARIEGVADWNLSTERVDQSKIPDGPSVAFEDDQIVVTSGHVFQRTGCYTFAPGRLVHSPETSRLGVIVDAVPTDTEGDEQVCAEALEPRRYELRVTTEEHTSDVVVEEAFTDDGRSHHPRDGVAAPEPLPPEVEDYELTVGPEAVSTDVDPIHLEGAELVDPKISFEDGDVVVQGATTYGSSSCNELGVTALRRAHDVDGHVDVRIGARRERTTMPGDPCTADVGAARYRLELTASGEPSIERCSAAESGEDDESSLTVEVADDDLELPEGIESHRLNIEPPNEHSDEPDADPSVGFNTRSDGTGSVSVSGTMVKGSSSCNTLSVSDVRWESDERRNLVVRVDRAGRDTSVACTDDVVTVDYHLSLTAAQVPVGVTAHEGVEGEDEPERTTTREREDVPPTLPAGVLDYEFETESGAEDPAVEDEPVVTIDETGADPVVSVDGGLLVGPCHTASITDVRWADDARTHLEVAVDAPGIDGFQGTFDDCPLESVPTPVSYSVGLVLESVPEVVTAVEPNEYYGDPVRSTTAEFGGSGECPQDTGATEVEGQTVCDLNLDGDFRDVDGDGGVGQGDVAEFFNKQHREAWKQPDLFDFSGNGAVTHGDVVELFDYVALN